MLVVATIMATVVTGDITTIGILLLLLLLEMLSLLLVLLLLSLLLLLVLLLLRLCCCLLSTNIIIIASMRKSWDAVKSTPAWNAVITSLWHWLPQCAGGWHTSNGPSGVVTGLPAGGPLHFAGGTKART